jgi:ribosome-associated protein
LVADLALGRKGLDVVVIDLRDRSAYTDFLVIASGTSDRHVQALAEHIQDELGKAGVRALGTEGLREGQWALVDLGGVVVHVFHEYTRDIYDLESMWRDAPRLEVVPQRSVGQALH